MDSKKISISNANTEHIEQILKICDEALGDGYLNSDFLSDAINNKNNTFCIVAREANSETIFGYEIFSIISDMSLINKRLQTALKKLKSQGKIGYLKTISVSRDYQRLGVGKKLQEYSIRFLKEKNITQIFTTAWNSGYHINAERMLLNSGFKLLCNLDNYWYEDSLEKQYQCPKCGNPCKCSCAVYCLAI